jgi:glutamate---cysteine ligase / carboxylate-amine ligase
VERHLSLGVEEEFHVADAASRTLTPDGDVVLGAVQRDGFAPEQFTSEIYLSMVETATVVCHTLDEVRSQLRALRGELCATAETHGLVVLAAGIMPRTPGRSQRITPDARYEQIEDVHQQVAREMMACGMHVHVGVDDREEAVGALNHVRGHLAPLLAMSANSPFWEGHDTGFASYRTVLWGRWPTAALPEAFADVAEYDAVGRMLINSGAIVDLGQIYWDVRLSTKHPTLEFRVADACMTVDEAVMQAGLCRALVRTALQQFRAGVAPPVIRPEALRAAKWRAARFGLEDRLFDPIACRLAPAQQVVHALLDHLRPALEAEGDWEEIRELVDALLADGSGAARQRAAFARAGRLDDTIDLIVRSTCR